MSDCSVNAFKVPKRPVLRPCPFCGSQAHVHKLASYDKYPIKWNARCDNKSCLAHVVLNCFEHEQEAADAWNIRLEHTCQNTNDPNARSWECSRCGESFTVNAADSNPFKFCPGCGAHVKVVDDANA